jgi:hypothetical protein
LSSCDDDGGGDQEIRGPATACEFMNQLCKWAPHCAESHNGVSVIWGFLVTGAGGSGTAWVRASLRRKGFDAAGESWGLRPQPLPPLSPDLSPVASEEHDRDGMVSWPARCWATDSQRHAMAAADEGHGLQVYTRSECTSLVGGNTFFTASSGRIQPGRRPLLE